MQFQIVLKLLGHASVHLCHFYITVVVLKTNACHCVNGTFLKLHYKNKILSQNTFHTYLDNFFPQLKIAARMQHLKSFNLIKNSLNYKLFSCRIICQLNRIYFDFSIYDKPSQSISNGVKNISVKIILRKKCSHNFQIFKHIYTMNKNVRAFYAFFATKILNDQQKYRERIQKRALALVFWVPSYMNYVKKLLKL